MMNHIKLLEFENYKKIKKYKEQKAHDHLQYVFACLVTHSQWIKKSLHDLQVIDQYFNLSSYDKRTLKSFMSNQGKHILAASLIMEEKRWREVLLVLKLVTQIIDKTALYQYWLAYLEASDLTAHIPSTPIIESIEFLNFLLTRCNPNRITTAIVRYELLKNTALAHQFVLENDEHQVNVNDISNNFKDYKIKINPSLFMEKFDITISTIIKDLNHKKHTDLSNSTVIDQTENLIFFKNSSSGVVKVMCLNEEWYVLLACHASGSSHPGHKENYLHFIQSMQALDVISINKEGI